MGEANRKFDWYVKSGFNPLWIKRRFGMSDKEYTEFTKKLVWSKLYLKSQNYPQ